MTKKSIKISFRQRNHKPKTMYYVQETIGGWRQSYMFRGTYNQCRNYMARLTDTRASYNLVSEFEYEVDYL
jgi:hypothetical protein